MKILIKLLRFNLCVLPSAMDEFELTIERKLQLEQIRSAVYKSILTTICGRSPEVEWEQIISTNSEEVQLYLDFPLPSVSFFSGKPSTKKVTSAPKPLPSHKSSVQISAKPPIISAPSIKQKPKPEIKKKPKRKVNIISDPKFLLLDNISQQLFDNDEEIDENGENIAYISGGKLIKYFSEKISEIPEYILKDKIFEILQQLKKQSHHSYKELIAGIEDESEVSIDIQNYFLCLFQLHAYSEFNPEKIILQQRKIQVNKNLEEICKCVSLAYLMLPIERFINDFLVSRRIILQLQKRDKYFVFDPSVNEYLEDFKFIRAGRTLANVINSIIPKYYRTFYHDTFQTGEYQAKIPGDDLTYLDHLQTNIQFACSSLSLCTLLQINSAVARADDMKMLVEQVIGDEPMQYWEHMVTKFKQKKLPTDDELKYAKLLWDNPKNNLKEIEKTHIHWLRNQPNILSKI